ncbi:MAG: hypothetical protein J3K34DRAFT_294148 [Monoraphidium minutum]|nr:MAG: hypothetical protein J3K34DRAFT_294148 [Monoraphidium minutum]
MIWHLRGPKTVGGQWCAQSLKAWVGAGGGALCRSWFLGGARGGVRSDGQQPPQPPQPRPTAPTRLRRGCAGGGAGCGRKGHQGGSAAWRDEMRRGAGKLTDGRLSADQQKPLGSSPAAAAALFKKGVGASPNTARAGSGAPRASAAGLPRRSDRTPCSATAPQAAGGRRAAGPRHSTCTRVAPSARRLRSARAASSSPGAPSGGSCCADATL